METVHDIIERLLDPIRLTVEEVEAAKGILAKAREAEQAAATESADTPEEAPAPDTLA